MIDDAGFEPLDGGSGGPGDPGQPSVSAREIAQAAAAAALEGTPAAPPTPTATPPGSEFSTMDSDTPAPSDEPVVPQPQEASQEAPQPTSTPTATVPEELSIFQDLGIPVEQLVSVPENVRETLTDVAIVVQNIQEEAQARDIKAEEAIARIKAFSERLETPEGKSRMILSTFFQDPEAFGKILNEVTRMQEDPNYAEAKRIELESLVRLEAATQREEAAKAVQGKTKGQKITSLTTRAAKRAGVDVGVAEQMVIARILQNEARTGQRDITPAEVNEIVTDLAARMGTKHPTPHKDPATQTLESTTPTTPVGTPPTPVTTPAASSATPVPMAGHEPQGLSASLRAAVGAASRNVRNKGL